MSTSLCLLSARSRGPTIQKNLIMSRFSASEIDTSLLAPEVLAECAVSKVLAEIRDQLISNGIQVTDIQSRVSRSIDAMLVFITVSTASHQRTLTAFDHFVNQAFRRGRAQGVNILVFWRYQLPIQSALQ